MLTAEEPLDSYLVHCIALSSHWACALYDKMAYQTHPLVNAPYTPTITYNCRDNAKLMSHGPARYKIEWIYTRTKVSGPDSLELALMMKKKERKIEKWPFFSNIWFWRVATIDLMNDLGLVR